MPRRVCTRHKNQHPCSCGMGNLYRFVEPLTLQLLQSKGPSCGYDLYMELRDHALTDAEIDKAALYRTLRQLEANKMVTSNWEESHIGPTRRVYKLTKTGEQHLEEWVLVLEHLSKSMAHFVRSSRKSLKQPSKPPKTR